VADAGFAHAVCAAGYDDGFSFEVGMVDGGGVVDWAGVGVGWDGHFGGLKGRDVFNSLREVSK